MRVENFVTLFDKNYLPQGVSLYLSMEREINCFHLWILALDTYTYEKLVSLDLKSVTILNVENFLTEELVQKKRERTKGEFCWTLTPFSFDFVFDSNETIERITYLDADLWFRKSPKDIFYEFDLTNKNVLITDHGYAPEYDQSAISGQYCVQFLTFDRINSKFIRDIWKEQCLEWCFNRAEVGRFGDQKYLDEWPIKFNDHVHVLKDHSLLLAPWNATRFPYGNSVAWHFHGLKIITDEGKNLSLELCSASYHLPEVVKVQIYGKYVADLNLAIALIS